MDEIVKLAQAKWPNVPHCYGWLALDARGHWYLRDDQAQAQGPFPTLQAGGAPRARGTRLQHEKLIEFIQRNYAADEAGQWYFQNGPQRVYVELEATPWVWRVGPDASVTAQTGATARVRECIVDELGRVYLDTDLGFGLVHTLDVALVAEALERGLWTAQSLVAADLPARYGYVTSPQARQAQTRP